MIGAGYVAKAFGQRAPQPRVLRQSELQRHDTRWYQRWIRV